MVAWLEASCFQKLGLWTWGICTYMRDNSLRGFQCRMHALYTTSYLGALGGSLRCFAGTLTPGFGEFILSTFDFASSASGLLVS